MTRDSNVSRVRREEAREDDEKFGYVQFISKDMDRTNFSVEQALRNAHILKPRAPCLFEKPKK